MPGKCCIPLCKGKGRDSRKIALFSFPKDAELLKTWMKVIPRVFQPTIHTKICHFHFHPQDICRTTEYFDERNNRMLSAPLKHPRLRDGAVPRYFPGVGGESRPSSDSESVAAETNSGKKTRESNPKKPSPPQSDDDGPKMVTVSCAYHHDTLVKGLWNFWRTNRGVDFYFQWGERSFEAHQILVDVFFSMEKLCQTAGNQTTADQGYLVDALLEFMYNGTIRIPEEHLDQLLAVAKQVEFTMLVNTLQQLKQTKLFSSTGSYPTYPAAKLGSMSSRGKSGSKNTRSSNRDTSANQKQQQANTTTQITRSAARNLRQHDSEIKPVESRNLEDDDSSGTADPPQLRKTASTKNTGTNQNVKPASEVDSGDTRRDDPASDRKSTDGNQESNPEDDSMSSSSEDDFLLASDKKSKQSIDANSKKGTKKPCRQTKTKDTAPDEEKKLPEAVSKRLQELAKELPPPQDVYNLPGLQCPDCDFKTTEFRSYRNHLQTAHKALKPSAKLKLRCRLCNFECRGRSAHKAHHALKHPGEKAFACQFCEKTFNRRSSMREHSANECAGRRRPRQIPLCDLCGKTFRNNFFLAQHKRQHTGEKIFMCHTCGKRLTTKRSLSAHYRVHSGEKPLVCHTCGKSFSDHSTLKRHMLLHEPNRACHPCSECSCTFTRREYLKQHFKRKHTDEPDDADDAQNSSDRPKKRRRSRQTFACRLCLDPPVRGPRTEMERHRAVVHPGKKIFGCDQCNYMTSTVPMLAIHARLHTGERPYKCNVCARTFRDGSNYKKHMKFHEPSKKPHNCFACGQAFSLRGNLKCHLKKVHSLSVEEVEAALGGHLPVQKPVQEPESVESSQQLPWERYYRPL